MEQGKRAEIKAKKYLVNQGLEWIASNVRYPFGELDIVMKQGSTWVFVEVKYRSNTQFGGALQAVNPKKIARLRKAANHYLQQHRINAPCRFDLIAINGEQLEWLTDIF